jgi:branched-subunit amino acid ABC-type transport system permease component
MRSKMRLANDIYAIFSTAIRELIHEIMRYRCQSGRKLLILHSGTLLAFTQTAMIGTDNKNGLLPQVFLLKVAESLEYRRSFRTSFIQRVIVSLSAAGSVMLHMFLNRTGENNDELFGAVSSFRPIRPNQMI